MTAKTTQVAKYENISDQVLAKIKVLQEADMVKIPTGYVVQNALKSAWLNLQEAKDRAGKPALEVCTKDSVANSLLDMVLQGLSVAKKQGYFIVYGNQLQFQRSYFGTVALAMRSGRLSTTPVANVIYEGDNFIYQISPKTGNVEIIKHEQKLDNIDNGKIRGAYAVLQLANGETRVTIMTKSQIEKAWNQGATRGKSPAHTNFAEEMSKKTVIGRACKMIINSMDDAWMYEGFKDEFDAAPTDRRDAEISQMANNEEFSEAVEVKEDPTAGVETQTKDANHPTGELFPTDTQEAVNETDAPY